jgi:uncharacterized cupredoxin-like copper-binding protein
MRSRRTARACAGAALLGLTLLPSACSERSPPGGAAKGAAKAGPSQVQITGSEFKFEPKDVSARVGEVILVVENAGMIEHNVVVETPGGQDLGRIPNIEVGKTERLTVNLRAGRYALICNLPGHKEAGMVGTITVGQ